MGSGQTLQGLDGRIGLALRFQRPRAANLGRDERGVVLGKRAIGGGRQVMLTKLLQHIGRKQQGIGMIGTQILRHAQVEKGIDRVGLAVERGRGS